MKPYCMSKYITKQDLMNDVMIATDIDDITRMQIIWNCLEEITKQRIKSVCPELYYCILAVIRE